MGFPGGSDDKESACNAGDVGWIPGLGRSPGEWTGNSLQYSCLENPMDRGVWQATVHRIAKSQTQLKWLSTHACHRNKCPNQTIGLFQKSPTVLLTLHYYPQIHKPRPATTLPICACTPPSWIRVPRGDVWLSPPTAHMPASRKNIRKAGKEVFWLLPWVVGTQAESSQAWSEMPKSSWKPKIMAKSIPRVIYPLLDFGK